MPTGWTHDDLATRLATWIRRCPQLLHAVEQRQELLDQMLAIGRRIDRTDDALQRERLQQEIEALRREADEVVDQCRAFHRDARVAMLAAAEQEAGLLGLYQELAQMHAQARKDPAHLKFELIQARQILTRAAERLAGAAEEPARQASAEPGALLTADQLAAILQVSTKTAYRLAQMGRIPHVRLGRSVRFRRGELEAWLAGRGWKPRGR